MRLAAFTWTSSLAIFATSWRSPTAPFRRWTWGLYPWQTQVSLPLACASWTCFSTVASRSPGLQPGPLNTTPGVQALLASLATQVGDMRLIHQTCFTVFQSATSPTEYL